VLCIFYGVKRGLPERIEEADNLFIVSYLWGLLTHPGSGVRARNSGIRYGFILRGLLIRFA
jgi:hypothetical protein